MKLPTQLTTNQDKFQYLSRVAELLRLEHNAKGADFRAGKITEKEFREYQKYDLEPRLEKVLFEREKIRITEDICEMKETDVFTEKQLEFHRIGEEGKQESKWDKDINLKSIG